MKTPEPVHLGITRTIETLKAIGLDIGSNFVSLYGVITGLLLAALLFILFKMAMRSTRWLLRRNHQLDEAQCLLTEKLIGISLGGFALLLGIDVLGIDLTALAFFSGALGLAIGFGLQKTVGNLIAGIILLMDRSIKPGDVIVVGDGSVMGGGSLPGGLPNVGRVAKIGVRAVNVITRDGKKHLIPNELLMTQPVENWSYASREVRVRMQIPVPYECDLRSAQAIIKQAAMDNARILPDPEPMVWITAFGPRAVDHELRYWIADPEAGLGNIQGEVFMEIWDRFQQAGIVIPYPRQDVLIKKAPDTDPTPSS
ncbi:mechanosensitive ion channel family protein [Sphingopyxis yananensis]|uniref:mechanosensitive ion channel family protein n=1 Tax=Sphingopyxis yananensis TaxID=2886687 RepID=UPI001D12ADF1|nr:mechanosensitive ion channel domain-containing protein [Sphingopyxis yananensis]MCC2601119.1 mechanosensitive ion channel [Sphingopyxis yananensis]